MLRFAEQRSRLWRVVVAIGSSITIVLALVLPFTSLPAAALPGGVPTHFAFGVNASPGDSWMPQSGIPWDYRMQYLAGGGHTGAGWGTWNPNGQFARRGAPGSAP